MEKEQLIFFSILVAVAISCFIYINYLVWKSEKCDENLCKRKGWFFPTHDDELIDYKTSYYTDSILGRVHFDYARKYRCKKCGRLKED